MTQSIEEQIRTLSTIEAELHLFEIGCKMGEWPQIER
jgi:hypothetical protein